LKSLLRFPTGFRKQLAADRKAEEADLPAAQIPSFTQSIPQIDIILNFYNIYVKNHKST